MKTVLVQKEQEHSVQMTQRQPLMVKERKKKNSCCWKVVGWSAVYYTTQEKWLAAGEHL